MRFYFLLICSSDLGSKIMMMPQNMLGSISLPLSSERIGDNHEKFIAYMVKFTWPKSEPGNSCFGRLFIIDSIYLIDTGLLK